MEDHQQSRIAALLNKKQSIDEAVKKQKDDSAAAKAAEDGRKQTARASVQTAKEAMMAAFVAVNKATAEGGLILQGPTTNTRQPEMLARYTFELAQSMVQERNICDLAVSQNGSVTVAFHPISSGKKLTFPDIQDASVADYTGLFIEFMETFLERHDRFDALSIVREVVPRSD